LQQQTSASARAQDAQLSGADAPEPTAAKAQAKCKATKDTKAQPKRQKVAPSSPTQLAPQSQAEPADAPKETIDPSDPCNGTSQIIRD